MYTLIFIWCVSVIWINFSCYKAAKKLGSSNKFEFITFKSNVWDKYPFMRYMMNFITLILLIVGFILFSIFFLP